MTENKMYPFMGGIIEEVPAGEFQGFDERSGQPRTFTWKDHVKVTTRSGKVKLSGSAIKALVDVYKKESDFRTWVEKCE